MINKDKLHHDIEQLMIYYSQLSASSPGSGEYYFDGVAEGLNKAWKLLDGQSLKECGLDVQYQRDALGNAVTKLPTPPDPPPGPPLRRYVNDQLVNDDEIEAWNRKNGVKK